MPQYFFLLGRTPLLSLAELQALLPHQTFTPVLPELVSVELESDEVASEIFTQLGGSLKVMKAEGQFTQISEETLLDYIVAYLAQFPKPTFGLAEFGRSKKPGISLQKIKNALKERSISSRFIESNRSGLSASVLLHQDVIEVNLIEDNETVMLAKTLAVQDIDDWTQRDRGKPYADRKKGMLPPKVARFMINLAVGREEGKRIYDPFCGTGTVLLEALGHKCYAIGSDLDPKAVAGAHQNLTWFAETYNIEPDFHVFHADVTSASLQDLKGQGVDAIVTEPFLGKQTPQLTQLPNIFKGLEKMYFGAFKNWTKLLNPGGVVVIVFPFVQIEKQSFSLEKMIDKLSQLGYTSSSEPIVYHRPDATVHRQIWKFTYQKQ
jgi:tRNA G10  N-methylase Trm11